MLQTEINEVVAGSDRVVTHACVTNAFFFDAQAVLSGKGKPKKGGPTERYILRAGLPESLYRALSPLAVTNIEEFIFSAGVPGMQSYVFYAQLLRAKGVDCLMLYDLGCQQVALALKQWRTLKHQPVILEQCTGRVQSVFSAPAIDTCKFAKRAPCGPNTMARLEGVTTSFLDGQFERICRSSSLRHLVIISAGEDFERHLKRVAAA